MKLRLTYRVVAMLTLVAFCQMLAVKALHHHAVLPENDIICAVDGESMHHHEAHHHHSFLPFFEEQDTVCAICQFQIVQVEQPLNVQRLATLMNGTSLFCFTDFLLLAGAYQFLLPRAPPVG